MDSTHMHVEALLNPTTQQDDGMAGSADLNAEAARIALICEGVLEASSADDATALAAAVEAASTELTLAAAAAVSAAANLTVTAAGILRSSAKMVEYHGKGACDAQGNVPKFAVKDAISTGKLFDPRGRASLCCTGRGAGSVRSQWGATEPAA